MQVIESCNDVKLYCKHMTRWRKRWPSREIHWLFIWCYWWEILFILYHKRVYFTDNNEQIYVFQQTLRWIKWHLERQFVTSYFWTMITASSTMVHMVLCQKLSWKRGLSKFMIIQTLKFLQKRNSDICFQRNLKQAEE